MKPSPALTADSLPCPVPVTGNFPSFLLPQLPLPVLLLSRAGCLCSRSHPCWMSRLTLWRFLERGFAVLSPPNPSFASSSVSSAPCFAGPSAPAESTHCSAGPHHLLFFPSRQGGPGNCPRSKCPVAPAAHTNEPLCFLCVFSSVLKRKSPSINSW